MSWIEHHQRSEEFASLAEILHRQGELEAAQQNYAIAAAAEIQALNHITPDETRTLGITVVSAIALSFKAKDYSQAKQLAYHWLDRQQLPKFVVLQVEEMLREILTIEALVMAG